MPWIMEDLCVGCGICVDECPAGAISVRNKVADLDMNSCIRCGICHDICSREAIRHDRERVPMEIMSNLERAEWSMSQCEKLLGDPCERIRCHERLVKHFNKEKLVAEETLKELEKLRSGFRK